MSKTSKHKFNLSENKLALLQKLYKQEGLESSVKTILPRDRNKPVFLSFAQQRLWFLDQLEPHNPTYNMFRALRLTGHLNVQALEQSIIEIVRRHEVLRTSFAIESHVFVQKIIPVEGFTLKQVDISAMPYEKREVEGQRLAIEEGLQAFDLSAGPLIRSMLVKLQQDEHLLIVTVHHIATDRWSRGILNRELSILYEAFSRGNPSPLTELPIQYADFAVWQRKMLQRKKLEEHLAFWKQYLKGVSTLDLPTDYQRPLVQNYHGAKHDVLFSEELSLALKKLSNKEGVTLFMTLLASFQILLHRYSQQNDIVVGTPIANRTHAEIEELIGFFVNTLVLRANMSGDPVFRVFLQGTKKAALGAYAHQDMPFEKLVEEVQPERDLSRNPLFQVLFSLQNAPQFSLELSGISISQMPMKDVRTKFDMEIYMHETTRGLTSSFVYNTDLFDTSTIERMAGHYQRILEGIISNPDQRLSELPLLTEAERYQLLEEWNDTKVEYPRGECIHELFEEQVERNPDATAIIFEEQRLTYRELNRKANQLAHYLRKQGVGPEVLVGICIERSPEMIIGIIAILKAGGAYVPLDPSYPNERLAYFLQDSGASILVSQESLLHILPRQECKVICLDADWETIAQSDQQNPSCNTTTENAAYVIYTSGSTGNPKGVIVNHNNVARLFQATQTLYQFNGKDVWTLFLCLLFL